MPDNYGYRDLKDYAQRIETTLRALPAVSKIQRIGDQKEQIVISESQQKASAIWRQSATRRTGA
jgi:multidrug efflux pump subunit AcrB